MNPIISPWWFYWIDVLGSIRDVLKIILGVSFALLVVVFMLLPIICDCFDYVDISKETVFKCLKKLIIVLLIALGVYNFIPSRETMYTMLVAQNVTYENVEKAAGIIQDSVDYIFDKFNENK